MSFSSQFVSAIKSATLVMLLSLSSAVLAASDLKTIMQNPDWIGPPVEAAWWQLDDGDYVFRIKQSGSTARELYRVEVESPAMRRLEDRELDAIDGPEPSLSRDRQRAVTIVEGSLVLRDLVSGAHRRLFTGESPVREAHFASSGETVYFRTGQRWWQVGIDGSAALPLTDIRFADEPWLASDKPLEAEQLRLFSTLEREREWQETLADQHVRRASAAKAVGAAPWYLEAGWEIAESGLSADGRWLLVSVRSDKGQSGAQDKMPQYVTRSGYVEVEDVRRLVGRDAPRPEQLWLLDLVERQVHRFNLSSLEGIAVDPLRTLKERQGMTPHDSSNPRPVRIDGIEWHPEKALALVQIKSLDFKDRWTVRIDAPARNYQEIHRLTDSAWINWDFNEFGWIPDTDEVWLLSEETGFGHLYRIDIAGVKQPLTRGEFELRDIQLSADGRHAYALSNRNHPTEWDLYRVAVDGNAMDQLTWLKGVESYAPHPRGGRVLLRYSASYIPAQAAVLDLEKMELVAATDTRTAEYRAIEWQQPEYVPVPSSHGAKQPIWSKFYRADPRFKGPRPAVMFVHGAGYTQNTHHKFPYYFREQMFHNLLTSRGYHVLDMDYRASEGYGRDWRTAIYRQMGTPELEDYIDGAQWLVGEHQVDPARIGIYGGSYGGFMTFMAMFKSPDIFAAGAALRPVTDWRHYNHGYTGSILNSPEIDPEAHRRSSPIEFAEGLRGDLLISHGMLDDNVFYKDSVRLAQRLIELEKEDWELASYPLEPHGYVHPEAWLDQYRRILKLFERTLNSGTSP